MASKLIEFFTGGAEVQKARKKMDSLSSRERKQGRLKASHKTQFTHARSVTRRHVLKVIAATGAPLLGAAAAGLVLNRTAHPPLAKRSQQPTIQELIAFQEKQKMRTDNALKIFLKANARTELLFSMLHEHAFYSIPQGPRLTTFIAPQTGSTDIPSLPSNNPHSFEVVFMPEVYAEKLSSAITWDQRERTLRISAEIDSDEWLAIFLYHELSHVHDALFGGENPNNQRAWLEGETRAHELECNLIAQWKPAEYKRLTEEGLALWKAGNLDGIAVRAHSLFPPASATLSGRAQDLINAAFIACVAFEHGQRHNKDLVEVYRDELLPLHRSVLPQGRSFDLKGALGH